MIIKFIKDNVWLAYLLYYMPTTGVIVSDATRRVEICKITKYERHLLAPAAHILEFVGGIKQAGNG